MSYFLYVPKGSNEHYKCAILVTTTHVGSVLEVEEVRSSK
jgi:hypothetical protein